MKEKAKINIWYLILTISLVISQLGIPTVLAETIAAQDEDFQVEISTEKRQYTMGEDIQVDVSGTESDLDKFALTDAAEMQIKEEKRVDTAHKKYIVTFTKAGNYSLSATIENKIINGPLLTIENTLPEEVAQVEKVTETSDSQLENTEESKKSETSVQKEPLLRQTRAVSTELTTSPKDVSSTALENITYRITGNAGDIVESNGLIQLKIPKEAVRSSDGQELVDKLLITDPVSFVEKTSDADNWILTFSIDVSEVDHTTTFETYIKTSFIAATFYEGEAKQPANPYTVVGSYANKTLSDTFNIIPIRNGNPPFGKYYYGDKEMYPASTDTYGILDLNDAGKNKFALVVNYDHIARNNVVVKDVLPEGTELTPYPGAFDFATGSRTPIAGGIRIAEAGEDASGKQTFNYVSADFIDKVTYDAVTREITVNFGNLPADKSYMIEYALDVNDPEHIKAEGEVKNKASMSYDGGVYRTAYPLQIKDVSVQTVGLSKQVDKTIVNLNDNELTYNLRLKVYGGVLPAGAVITDNLDASKIDFDEWVSTIDDEIFDTDVTNNVIKITTKKDLIGPLTYDFSFKADSQKLKTGETVTNDATITNKDQTLKSSQVSTKRIDGRLKVIKIDDSGQTLADAEFDIKDTSGNIVDHGKTNASGEFLSTPLAVGNYQIIETKAPEGYVLEGTPHNVSVTSDAIEPIEISINNKKDMGDVLLTKLDKNTSEVLSGAVFELQDKEGKLLRSALQTDSKGKLLVTDLVPGDYQLVETKAPTGYVLDSTPLAFTIVKNQTQVVEVSKVNELIPGGVVLQKVDADTSEVLAGAVFELQDQTDKTLQNGLVTGLDGKLVINDLAPGEYQLVETKAPTGYEIDRTPVSFTVEKGQTKVVEVEKQNQLTTGGVVLQKVDADTSEVLAGAVFELQDQSGNPEQSGLMTGSDGKLAIDNLKPGEYQLVETKAPTGYELDQTPIRFTIEKAQTKAVELKKSNKLITGSVVLTKADATTAEALAGAVFDLYNDRDEIVEKNLTTGQDGKLAVKNLRPGNYYFIETQAPTGYVKDDTPINFTIVKDQNQAIELTKTNHLTPGGVVLTKVDAESADPLSGAVFELQDMDGKILQKGLKTGADGKLAIDKLTPGNYQFVETQAPTGYELDQSPITFTIEKGQTKALELTKSNKQVKGSITLEKIDKQTGETLPGAVFELQDEDHKVIIKEMETDQAGRLSVQELKPGVYYFVEKKAPNGYDVDPTPLKVVVKEKQANSMAVEKTNEGKKKALRVVKKDKASMENLKDAVFSLFDKEGNELEKDLITDDNGTFALDDLDVGEYQLKETKAPEGYVIDSTPINFKIEEKTELITIDVYNAKEETEKSIKNSSGGSTLPDAGNSSSSGKTGNSTYYPKTGEKQSTWIVISGIFLIGTILYIVSKKRKIMR